MDKLIITTSLTGGVTLPSQTPYLPITPDQIAQSAIEACQAGAAIVHTHARDPVTGKPSQNPDLFREIITKIKSKCNVVINITTGGSLTATREQRVMVVPTFKPELASLNMGSMNFSIHPAADRIKEFKFDWEEPYARNSKDGVFRNTFEDMEFIFKTMVENNVKPELEVYDVGQLYNTSFLIRRSLIPLPVHLQFVTGVLGGIGNTFQDLQYLQSTADRLIGAENYTWSVIGVGYPAEFHLGAIATIMGGHVRVGLEDNLFIERGVLAKSNAELVGKMVRIAKELGREIATPDEARQMLHLKGIENVGY
jgi:uncharacterized protein (DUF849 family)